MSKLPESKAIDPENSPTMKKLELTLVAQVKSSQTYHGSKCIVFEAHGFPFSFFIHVLHLHFSVHTRLYSLATRHYTYLSIILTAEWTT